MFPRTSSNFALAAPSVRGKIRMRLGVAEIGGPLFRVNKCACYWVTRDGIRRGLKKMDDFSVKVPLQPIFQRYLVPSGPHLGSVEPDIFRVMVWCDQITAKSRAGVGLVLFRKGGIPNEDADDEGNGAGSRTSKEDVSCVIST